VRTFSSWTFFRGSRSCQWSSQSMRGRYRISFRRLVELKLKGKESTGCRGQQTAHAENNAEDLPLRLGGECLDSIGGGLEDW
jgi:hypothetical protein